MQEISPTQDIAMTQLGTQPNMMLSAPSNAPPMTQPGMMGAPMQTQLDPASAAGPGQGGAATAAGVGAVMQQDQGMNAPPQQQQGGAPQDMALESGQPVAGQEQQPPAPPAWNPGAPNAFSQSGMLYNQGQGPVTSQVPPMTVAASYRPVGQERATEAPRASSVDVELLSTGSSARFRERCAGVAGRVEHVQHTIAPVVGQGRETGVSVSTKIANNGHMDQASLPKRLPLRKEGKGLVAIMNFIDVNEKSAKSIGPNEAHTLNHPADGPMKRSAVGESGLILGERAWQVNGADAWPTTRSVGRATSPRGTSKMAGVGSAVKGIGGAIASKVAPTLGKVKQPVRSALGYAAKPANPTAQLAKRMGLGAGAGGATYAGGEAAGFDMPGNFGDYVAGGSALGALGPGFRQGMRGLVRPGMANQALRHEAGTVVPQTLLQRTGTEAVRRGGAGYGVGALGDVGVATMGPEGAKDPNLRGTLGATGAATGLISGAMPGRLGTAASIPPALYGIGQGGADMQTEVFSPGVLKKTEQLVADNPTLAAWGKEMHPEWSTEDIGRAYMSGEYQEELGAYAETPEGLRALGEAGMASAGDKELAGKMTGAVETAGMDQIGGALFSEENWAYARQQAAEQAGVKPEQLNTEQFQAYANTQIDRVRKAETVLGGDGPLGKLFAFFHELKPTQQAMVAGSVIAGIVSIVSAMAGKGGMAAAGLLGALGLGIGSYFTGDNKGPYQGLIGSMQPGDLTGATESAEGAGMDTPAAVDARAQESDIQTGEAATGAPGASPADKYMQQTPYNAQWQQLPDHQKDILAKALGEAAGPEEAQQVLEKYLGAPSAAPAAPGMDRASGQPGAAAPPSAVPGAGATGSWQ